MVSHEDVRAALSARVDGEPGGLDDAVVDTHLAACSECAAYYQRLLSLSRNLSFAVADGGMAPPKDLSEVILAGVEGQWRTMAQRRAVALSLCRVALAVTALVWAVWAVRPLIADPASDPAPAAVRLGVACALVYAALRPVQIPGIAMVVGTMFTFILGFAVRDAVLGTGHFLAGHVLVLGPTLLALGATLAVDRGPQLRRAWRALSADP